MTGSLHEECGVFGIFDRSAGVASNTCYGLYALQHRGQESCGIAVCDDGVMRCEKASGLVSEVFDNERIARLGQARMAVGHVRYSTTGGSEASNIQPLCIRHIKGNMALVHNGNLVNAAQLRESFEMSGAIFHCTTDTEAIAYAIVRERIGSDSTEQAIAKAMQKLKGAYSCIVMTATKLIAFRDPFGLRPLCIGVKDNGAYVFASESCALDAVGAKLLRDVEAGEIVTVSEEGLTSIKTPKENRRVCIFEYIYFARPDSVIEGVSVHHSRIKAGHILAQHSPIDADVVIGVPDSGIDAALGFAEQSGIPYGIGFIKNKYIGRSFIEPTQAERADKVRIKLSVIKETVANKCVVMIDDSIVRGTTSARIIKLLREAGASEVHVRITAPPFLHSCYFGTDIDSEENLISSRLHSTEAVAKAIGADSLAFFPIERLGELAGEGFCDGCFSGVYPVDVSGAGRKNKFDKKIHES